LNEQFIQFGVNPVCFSGLLLCPFSELSAPSRICLWFYKQGSDIGMGLFDGGLDPGHTTFNLTRAQPVLELGAKACDHLVRAHLDGQHSTSKPSQSGGVC
jgi:hypothetical protein